MKYLLDTNIICELRKKCPNKNFMLWWEDVPDEDLYLSCVSIGEIKFGAIKKLKTDKNNGELLIKWLDRLLKTFQNKILNIDTKTCLQWGNFLNLDQNNSVDALIAAQASVNNLILVTRNTKHIKIFNVPNINPFL